MKAICMVLACALVLCAAAVGQSSAPEAGAKTFFWQQIPAPEPGNAPPAPNVFFNTQTVAGQPGIPGLVGYLGMLPDNATPVTGAPYTATATTETTQVLADGNRIVNKTTAFLARDGQGRTRREETMATIGPLGVNTGVHTLVNKTVAANGSKIVFINDPVSGVNYVLDTKGLTAQAVKANVVVKTDAANSWQRTTVNGPTGATVIIQRKAVAQAPGAATGEGQERIQIHLNSAEAGELKTESLGTRVIEGVSAEGKVMIRTIPAGQIGNERPINITQEVWTSPELHMVVLSQRNDPRFGETVYRLSDIKLGEPDHSLFEVPNNFTLRQMPSPWKETSK